MKLQFSAEEQFAWADKNRAAVEAKTGEPVLAFSTFYRSGSMGAMVASRVSPLAASAIKLMGKKKAGGLPDHFILAATAERLYALSYKAKRDAIEPRDEVAVWERAAIRVSAEDTAVTKRLTIESPAEGEKVVCDTGRGAITDDFLAELGAGQAAVAA